MNKNKMYLEQIITHTNEEGKETKEREIIGRIDYIYDTLNKEIFSKSINKSKHIKRTQTHNNYDGTMNIKFIFDNNAISIYHNVPIQWGGNLDTEEIHKQIKAQEYN